MIVSCPGSWLKGGSDVIEGGKQHLRVSVGGTRVERVKFDAVSLFSLNVKGALQKVILG